VMAKTKLLLKHGSLSSLSRLGTDHQGKDEED